MKTLRLVNAQREMELLIDDVVTHPSGAGVIVHSLLAGSVDPRLGAKNRYGKDGVIITGDQRVGQRRLSMTLSVSADNTRTDNAYRECIEDIIAMFDPLYGPTYLYDDQDDAGSSGIPRRTEVVLSSEDLRPSEQGMYARLHRGSLDMLMVNGVWETADEFEVTSGSGGVANGETVTVVNNSRMIAYPVIEVTALSDNQLFRLSNSATGAYVEIGATDFLQGNTMTISSIDGSIILNDSDISASSIGEGSAMLELIPGSNDIAYDSAYGDVEITVRWRERWLR